jgi:DNA-binding transcriptional ArsR family regulator
MPHNHDTCPTHPTPADGADFTAAAALFRLLGDASRLRIFWVLCHGEACVAHLSDHVGMSSPAVSHHLRQLRDTGLVTSRRDGKEVRYRAADTETARQLHRMIETMVEITCPMPDSDHDSDR